MATGRTVVTPKLVTQYRTTLEPILVITTKAAQQQEDPVQDTLSSLTYRTWGKALSAHAPSMV